MKKIISIRAKIIGIVLINVLTLVVLIYTISSAIISKNYIELEQADNVKNLERAEDAVAYTLSELTVRLTDWAFWDDTYQYVKDKNEAYAISNLGNGSISNLKINMMVFVDTEGKIVFKKAIDLEKVAEVPSENIKSHVDTHDKLIAHTEEDSFIEGIISLPEGPLLISSRPILTSDGVGPVRGTLIFGKFLTDEIVESVAKLARVSLTIYDFNSTTLPADVLNAKLKLSRENIYFVEPVSQNEIVGYKVLYDLYDEPILIIRTNAPREVYNQGQFTIYFFIGVASVLIISFGFILIFLLEKIVISRLKKLGAEVENISLTGDLSFRVKEGVHDEIGKLGKKINHMLEALASSKKIAKETSDGIELVGMELGTRMVEIEKMNKLMIDRELKMIELKKEISDLKEKSENK